MLREAAAAAQKKALAKRPSDAEAGTGWCVDGGTIVLASYEQVLAFQKASQPVSDKLEQDSFNAESFAAIRELKAKTQPSAGAQACAPTVDIPTQGSTENQIWSQGLPPNGTWTVSLTTLLG
jgi:TRAP-type transport system periplasmic protein